MRYILLRCGVLFEHGLVAVEVDCRTIVSSSRFRVEEDIGMTDSIFFSAGICRAIEFSSL